MVPAATPATVPNTFFMPPPSVTPLPFGTMVNPYGLQLVDDQGRNVRPRLDTLHVKRNPATWQLGTSQRMGPPNFIVFSKYLAGAGAPVQGALTATNEPAPSTWTVQPATLSMMFRNQFLHPDATGSKAKAYLWSSLQGQMPTGAAFFAQPTSTFGARFFQDSTFKRFREGAPWLPVPLDSEEDFKDNFTTLHLYSS